MVFTRSSRRPRNGKRKTFRRNGRSLAIRKNYYKPPSVFFFSRWSRGEAFSRAIEDINDWPLAGSGDYRVIWKQFQYTLSGIVGFEEFTALFRFYKIHKVVTRITFSWNDAISRGDEQPGNQPSPITWRPWANWRAFSLIDKSFSRDWEDETVVPGVEPNNTLFNAKQFNSFKMYNSMKTITRVTRPQCVNIVDNLNVALPSAQTNYKTWYLTNRPQQRHFSLVFGVQPAVPFAALPNKWYVSYTADTKYYFSLRGMQ